MRKTNLFLLFSLIFLLTGCWDEQLLKYARLEYVAGFDFDESRNYKTTSLLRTISRNLNPPGGGDSSQTLDLVLGTGKTVRESRLSINRAIEGEYDPSKGRVLILGNEAAKSDIYKFLDVYYRNPHTPINSELVVSEGTANSLLEHIIQEESAKGGYLYELIKSAEKNTESPELTIQTVCTYLFDEGKDFVLPYLGIDKEQNKIKVKGLAIFNEHSFTGEVLNPEDSTLLLLFMNKLNKSARFSHRLNLEQNTEVTYNITKMKRSLKIEERDKIQFTISINLDVAIDEYPEDQLDKKKNIEKLNKLLSNQLTDQAENIFTILSETNSDTLGLGRELIAYHPEKWEKIHGKNYYEKIKVIPKVKVNIISSGIIL
ncbi:Ger(x)C family spore germination protein [Cytobacillus firmus]|nr:Ger(x)C family spore germination protein [Cytobacillus firmus]